MSVRCRTIPTDRLGGCAGASAARVNVTRTASALTNGLCSSARSTTRTGSMNEPTFSFHFRSLRITVPHTSCTRNSTRCGSWSIHGIRNALAHILSNRLCQIILNTHIFYCILRNSNFSCWATQINYLTDHTDQTTKPRKFGFGNN